MVARWWYWSGCADIIALLGWLRLSGHPAAEQQPSAVEAFLGLRGRQCRHFVCWPALFRA